MELMTLIQHNRIFRTEKEAKFERERVKFQIFMDREFAKNSDPIDWEDEDQIRCPIYD